MAWLLDTNVCIAAMKGHPGVIARLSGLSPHDCVISAVTAFELMTGVEKCADPVRERQRVERLLSAVRELPFDAPAAREAARIRAALESAGQMIGPYDTLLAGHAMSSGLILVTRNEGEFRRVTRLTVENWQAKK
jgi:tRNA(fMet)-specific endonuclease VapC